MFYFFQKIKKREEIKRPIMVPNFHEVSAKERSDLAMQRVTKCNPQQATKKLNAAQILCIFNLPNIGIMMARKKEVAPNNMLDASKGAFLKKS